MARTGIEVEYCKQGDRHSISIWFSVHHSFQTLIEEMRKVQSSAAVLERQRKPAVGYWGAFARFNGSEPQVTSPPGSPSRTSSPASSSVTAKDDEEINFEYLRNVILQFLEHKEMRVCLSSAYPSQLILNGSCSPIWLGSYLSSFTSPLKRRGGSLQKSRYIMILATILFTVAPLWILSPVRSISRCHYRR